MTRSLREFLITNCRLAASVCDDIISKLENIHSVRNTSDLERMLLSDPAFLTKEIGVARIVELRILDSMGYRSLEYLSTIDIQRVLSNLNNDERIKQYFKNHNVIGIALASVQSTNELVAINLFRESQSLHAQALFNKIQEWQKYGIHPSILSSSLSQPSLTAPLELQAQEAVVVSCFLPNNNF